MQLSATAKLIDLPSVLSLSLISSYTSIKQSRKCQWPILVQWVPEFYLPFLTLHKLLFNHVISCFCPLFLACSRSFSIGSVARSLIAIFCKTRDASLENILNDNKVVINLSSSWLSCFCLPLGDNCVLRTHLHWGYTLLLLHMTFVFSCYRRS
jgi:hypothetical protein